MKIEDLLLGISNLNLIELAKLVSEIEKKFNLNKIVNNDNLEKKFFNVYLKNIGDKKISIIKIIKEITNLSLKESKDLVEKKESLIKKNITKKECDEIALKINNLGGTVEIK
ncbi:ribosomal protein L7/L12 [Candidatus Carsonella ruddii]|uniref:50S ribosomal protein L7/L12 n=1 Tax=Candidatus Carsonella ruddii CE isolate Thao2000 TaxID=1202536 RepID=J7GW54_CARRU|nr:ribosomal protein L7/L12 [Candidatus Carsonella ruddii]AFP83646.1 ribosomal protein L7/L12 [Candidatus Carsonella ruddii CE isolate Thao2000]